MIYDLRYREYGPFTDSIIPKLLPLCSALAPVPTNPTATRARSGSSLVQ